MVEDLQIFVVNNASAIREALRDHDEELSDRFWALYNDWMSDYD